jgi:hypothetical protein
MNNPGASFFFGFVGTKKNVTVRHWGTPEREDKQSECHPRKNVGIYAKYIVLISEKLSTYTDKNKYFQCYICN